MNKKIIMLVSVAVIAAILLLLGIGKLTPIGQAPSLVLDAMEVVATLLALPAVTGRIKTSQLWALQNRPV